MMKCDEEESDDRADHHDRLQDVRNVKTLTGTQTASPGAGTIPLVCPACQRLDCRLQFPDGTCQLFPCHVQAALGADLLAELIGFLVLVGLDFPGKLEGCQVSRLLDLEGFLS